MALALPILALLVVGAGAIFLLAQQQGISVSDEVSNIASQTTGAVTDLPGSLGLSSDPIALALPIIKNFEGFSAKAYEDPKGSGKYSIGYGHQIQPGDPYDQNSTILESDASALLESDVQSAYACVGANCETELTPNQTAALVSFAFNVGCSAFANSTLAKLVNQGDFEGAAAQFPSWIHAGGSVSSALVDRRTQEQELFNS